MVKQNVVFLQLSNEMCSRSVKNIDNTCIKDINDTIDNTHVVFVDAVKPKYFDDSSSSS